MKIIRQGVIPSEIEAEFGCNRCNSVLSAKRGEGECISDQRDGDCIGFICPVCKNKIWVSVRKFQ